MVVVRGEGRGYGGVDGVTQDNTRDLCDHGTVHILIVLVDTRTHTCDEWVQNRITHTNEYRKLE